MTRRGVTTSDRRPATDERRSGGRSVAERAFGQIRLVAVALVLLGGAGYRPADGAAIGREVALPLVGAVCWRNISLLW